MKPPPPGQFSNTMLIFAQDAWKNFLKETMGASGDLPRYKLSIWFGRKPCTQTFTKKQSHLVEIQKVNPKTLHRKIQPTSSIDNCRWFPSWKRRLPLKNRVFLNLPKGITIFKGLAFLASGRAPTIFHGVEFSIEEPAFPSPFPPFFHPHPGWPTGPTCDPFRHGRHLIALSRQGRPWRLQGEARESHSRHRDAALVLKPHLLLVDMYWMILLFLFLDVFGGYIDIQCLVLHWPLYRSVA